MEHRWNEIDRKETEVFGEKTCPSATLSTTNPTWTDLGLNPGLRGERAATNRLSHGRTKGRLVFPSINNSKVNCKLLSQSRYLDKQRNDAQL
jgi:hypothetical protein